MVSRRAAQPDEPTETFSLSGVGTVHTIVLPGSSGPGGVVRCEFDTGVVMLIPDTAMSMFSFALTEEAEAALLSDPNTREV